MQSCLFNRIQPQSETSLRCIAQVLDFTAIRKRPTAATGFMHVFTLKSRIQVIDSKR
ncbi:MAG: hypothetical protein OFPII_16810 [Osedax symbiont Rs1]|nr:MAG: hypothetical protein OFPII_16810 [Osedax symbiont Rs1]